uniref:Uncharacterized protein n=1 Tax=Ditylenchus dipsaci TaxID=166011 RepID=A0A915DKC1_9BILA
MSISLDTQARRGLDVDSVVCRENLDILFVLVKKAFDHWVNDNTEDTQLRYMLETFLLANLEQIKHVQQAKVLFEDAIKTVREMGEKSENTMDYHSSVLWLQSACHHLEFVDNHIDRNQAVQFGNPSFAMLWEQCTLISKNTRIGSS